MQMACCFDRGRCLSQEADSNKFQNSGDAPSLKTPDAIKRLRWFQPRGGNFFDIFFRGYSIPRSQQDPTQLCGANIGTREATVKKPLIYACA